MRRNTDLFANVRGMCFSPRGWGDRIHVGTIEGGANEMMPSALAVLAASEARLIFLLVKLSGNERSDEGGSNEHEAGCATLSGEYC